jgi:hypothetical protein
MPLNEEQQQMPTIKRKTANGFRFSFIQPAELDKMLAAGTARKLGNMPAYEEVEISPSPVEVLDPEDLDNELDEDTAPAQRQTYQTADLKAEPKRRRGRPRKLPAVGDAE